MSVFVNKVLLFPYYLTLKIRNKLYDNGTLRSSRYEIPIISIGNVTVGGTGKTPHTEMFIRILQKKYRIAVVSRGYGRKTKGNLTVSSFDKASKVGDEPLQIKRKFPDVTVMVDKNRRRAIEKLLSLDKALRPELILLDDALQYRSIIPARSVVLINYSRPVFKDNLLPLGRLRDLPEQIGRADTVIITKCPVYLDEWEKEKCKIVNKIRNNQFLTFSNITYKNPRPIFDEIGDNRFIYSQEVILFAGIADSKSLRNYLASKYSHISYMSFADHHNYKRKDIRAIYSLARRHPRALVLTTEKDAQRIVFDTCIPDPLKPRMFYIPIEVKLLEGEDTSALFHI